MVWDLLIRVGVGKEQHLRVGMHGEVELDSVFVRADEFSHSFHLWLGPWELTAVYLRTGIAGGSLRFKVEHYKRGERNRDSELMRAWAEGDQIASH